MKIKLPFAACLACGLMICQCAARDEKYHIENRQEQEPVFVSMFSANIVTTNTAAVSVTWHNGILPNKPE